MRKPKLSPEEKKLLKEQKKLEKKRAAEEAARQVKRDHLTRELKMSEMNRKKLEPQWRKMLHDINSPVMRIELQLAINNLERMLDAKDYMISLLLDELDNAEEQYRKNFRSHCENIYDNYNLYHSRLDELKEQYEMEKYRLERQAYIETKENKNKTEEEETHLQIMTYGLEVEDKNVDRDTKTYYLCRLNEQNSHAFNALENKKSQIETKFEVIWIAYTEVLNNFLKTTADKRKEYEVLQSQDKVLRNKIKEQSQQLCNAYRAVATLKEKQIAVKEIFTETVTGLIEERDFFTKAVKRLRQQVIVDKNYDGKQLIFLVQRSNKAIKGLDNTYMKGERILNVTSLNRKYETQSEKILPFPKSQPEVSDQPTAPLLYSDINLDVVKELEPFWQKCAKGDALRHLLNEELAFFKKVNYFMKQQIVKKCFESQNACKLPQLKHKTHKKKRPLYIVEAAHIVDKLHQLT